MLITGVAGAAGSMPFGSGPHGAGFVNGFSSLELRTFGLIQLRLEAPFQVGDRSLPWDILNPNLWTLTSGEATAHVPLVAWVDYKDGILSVYLDSDVSPSTEYALTLDTLNARLDDGTSAAIYQVSGTFTSFAQSAIQLATAQRTINQRYDLANPFVSSQAPFGTSSPLGTLQIDSSGDYANDSGVSYFYKRVTRRATVGLGEFLHLPDYGFTIPEKTILRPSDIRRLQARATQQILREPDCVSCQVVISTPAIGVVQMTIFATSDTGEKINAIVSQSFL